MPSDNPKVSAYIPPHIFDRFEQYKKEKNVSMSQAVAVIFAEYFQLDLQVNYSSSLLGGEAIITRLESLEKEVQDLKSSELHSSLLSDLQDLRYLVNQIEDRLSKVEANQSREPYSSLQNEPLELPQDDSVKQLDILEVIENQLEDDRDQVVEEKQQIEGLDAGEPIIGLLSELPIDVELDLHQLAKRLGTTYGTANNKKSRCKDNSEEFLNWIQSKDPDNIRWIESGFRGRAKLYKPVNDTSSELLSRLREWIEKNLK